MSDNVNKLFKSMVNDIIKVFPEYTKRLLNYYKETLQNESEEKDERLKEFLMNVNDISDDIVDDNFNIFESDPILLQNVSFKVIWNSDISDDNKSKIWKYLQTFCIISINEKSNDKIGDVIKSIESKEKVKDKETLKDLKKLKKLNKSIETEGAMDKLIGEKVNKEEKVDNKDNEYEGGEDMKKMENMFKNTGIGKIAKDITDELNIEEMLENGGGIEDIFKGENMGNIIQSISKKIGSEDLQGGDLVSEASTICSTMQGNPLFSSLMSNMGNIDPNNIRSVPVTKEKSQKKSNELNIEKVD
jgi:hypothetical protein